MQATSKKQAKKPLSGSTLATVFLIAIGSLWYLGQGFRVRFVMLAACLVHVFGTEDEGSTLLRNVVQLVPVYTTLRPTRHHSCCMTRVKSLRDIKPETLRNLCYDYEECRFLGYEAV
jgi:hypothetical protein